MQRIVVGVDGSAGGQAAMRWAVEEAARHGARVVAVRAWGDVDRYHLPHEPPQSWSHGEVEERDALRADVEAVLPAHLVEQRLVSDLPVEALVDAGRGADLLVVGARGLGGFGGLLLGSVSERVLERAPCPVAVVRPGARAGAEGAVVVGIDGSATASAALRWAAREAHARGAPLHVVHGWQLPAVRLALTAAVATDVEAAARRVLDAALDDAALSGLDVVGHLPRLRGPEAVLTRAEHAALIVTGSRGLGRLAGTLLGSTTRQLAHHAPCPIVVVPPLDR